MLILKPGKCFWNLINPDIFKRPREVLAKLINRHWPAACSCPQQRAVVPRLLFWWCRVTHGIVMCYLDKKTPQVQYSGLSSRGQATGTFVQKIRSTTGPGMEYRCTLASVLVDARAGKHSTITTTITLPVRWRRGASEARKTTLNWRATLNCVALASGAVLHEFVFARCCPVVGLQQCCPASRQPCCH